MSSLNRLGGLPALLAVVLLAGCQEANQKVNVFGPTPIDGGGENPPPGGGGGGGGGGSTPTKPGSFTLSLISCSPAGTGQNEAKISWTGSQGAANYRVERRVTSIGVWQGQGAFSGPAFSQVVDNRAKVWYRVIAINNHGETFGSPTELFACDEIRGEGGGGPPGGGDGDGGGTPPPTPDPAPTISFTANPSAIQKGHASALVWSSQHATSCSASGGWSGSKSLSGNQSVSPQETTTYVLACTGPGGSITGQVTISVTEAPPPPPAPKPAITFAASPTSITSGQSSALTWNVQHAESCAASGAWSGNRPLSGSQSVSPTGTASYVLSCTGKGGTDSKSVTVSVTPPPAPGVKRITLSPAGGSGQVGSTMQTSASCTIDNQPAGCSPWWHSSDPSRVSVGATSGLINFVSAGSATICAQWSQSEPKPDSCHQFTATALPEQPKPKPVISFSANPPSIQKGQSSTLAWNVQHATSCSASGGWSGNRALSGNQSVSPAATASYTLSCTGEGGTTTASVTINVTEAPAPKPKPVVTLTASPTSVNAGHASLLSWSSQHATSCSASGGWSGGKALSGSQSVSPANTTTYTLSCTGEGGTTNASATVTVTQPPPPPPPGIKTITLSPSGGSGKAGTTQQTVAVCRIDGQIVSCSPWWSSSDPSRVGVGSTNGLVQYIWNGSADICVQWSRTEVTPRVCHQFTATP